jgi:hypothetical protein
LSLQHLDSDCEGILLSISISVGVGARVHGLSRLLVVEVEDKRVVEALYKIDGIIVNLPQTDRNMLTSVLDVLRPKGLIPRTLRVDRTIPLRPFSCKLFWFILLKNTYLLRRFLSRENKFLTHLLTFIPLL